MRSNDATIFVSNASNDRDGKEDGKCYLYNSDGEIIEERMYEKRKLKSYDSNSPIL